MMGTHFTWKFYFLFVTELMKNILKSWLISRNGKAKCAKCKIRPNIFGIIAEMYTFDQYTFAKYSLFMYVFVWNNNKWWSLTSKLISFWRMSISHMFRNTRSTAHKRCFIKSKFCARTLNHRRSWNQYQ